MVKMVCFMLHVFYPNNNKKDFMISLAGVQPRGVVTLLRH